LNADHKSAVFGDWMHGFYWISCMFC